jgi:hypothetical protein
MTNIKTIEADFSNAVTMQARAIRLRSLAIKAGDYGNAATYRAEASKWAMTAWSLSSSIDRDRLHALATAARAAA